MVFIIENRNGENRSEKIIKKLTPVGKDGFVVKTRVREDEKLALKNYCTQTGETESSVLLRQIRILLSNGADFSKEEIAALRKATTQITAIGRNGRLTGQDIRLSYPARITTIGSLLDPEDVVRALREAHAHFVANGKIGP